jgi:hypothetical protein
VDDEAIRSLLRRLGRSDRSGGTVIERAAILAEGADFDAVMAWILAHGGEPEVTSAKASSTGLYGSHVQDGGRAESPPPSRFVLPADALR